MEVVAIHSPLSTDAVRYVRGEFPDMEAALIVSPDLEAPAKLVLKSIPGLTLETEQGLRPGQWEVRFL